MPDTPPPPTEAEAAQNRYDDLKLRAKRNHLRMTTARVGIEHAITALREDPPQIDKALDQLVFGHALLDPTRPLTDTPSVRDALAGSEDV